MNEKKEKMTVHAGPARQAVAEDSFAPAVDIYETQDGTTMMVAELPGAKTESVDIRVDKGVLTIYADGRLPEIGKDYTRTYTGFVSGEFFRAFALSDEIDRDKIEAAFKDGVLTVTLPKAAAMASRKIEIKS